MATIPGVSIMAALLAAAGLDTILGSQPATLFAPTDAAIAALLNGGKAGQTTLAVVASNQRMLDAFVRCAGDATDLSVHGKGPMS